MCGIVGWVNLGSNSWEDSLENEMRLRSMCGRIEHRGPDSEGVWLGKNVALGMRRLAIIDLSANGEQLVFNEDKSVVVVMNGEIYNAPELRAELVKSGYKFRGHSDTEVLPHLYEIYGENLVDKLNGMFAFALWDSRRQKLLLVRDRLGVKPLYYGVFGGKLIFASELKALTTHPAVETKLDIHALQQYLTFDYIPAPLSIYNGICKLPASHSITVENGTVTIKPYWNLSFQDRNPLPTLEEAAEELLELLTDATRIRLISDVPLGIFLSGGLDSSAITALAQKFSTKPLKTFCIGFAENSFDESRRAREVAEYLGTEHYEDCLSMQEAGRLLPEIAGWLDEPMSDASILPTFLLSRFVRSQVTVALGGDGADEIFAGYPSYYAHKLAERYEKIPPFIRYRIIENLINRLPNAKTNMSLEFMAKRFFKSLETKDTVARHHSLFGSFMMNDEEGLLTEAVQRQNGKDVYAESRNWLEMCDADNIVERTQFIDIKTYLAEGILTKIDRASMAVSLEVRSPFLDWRIAEFAAGLPYNYKLKCNSVKFGFGNTGKHILKKAVNRLIPPAIVKRRKKGFVIPVASWLNKELNPLLRELLAPERLKKQEIFNPIFVEKLLLEHESGKINHSQKLWNLLVFQLWLENFGSQKSNNFQAAAQNPAYQVA